nr:PREDICTED: sodium channel protein Nach isoform X1 [Tribolium castaneum]|eukprot:XP_008190485.2 PREDICTED: sodium channel protein Nach isoform X1 [Tribolium castaneum]
MCPNFLGKSHKSSNFYHNKINSQAASIMLMFNALDQYQNQKISFSVDTSYLNWQTNFPSIVICERSNPKKMLEANKKIFGSISQQFPKLETFVFFDGSIRHTQVCQPNGALRDKCLLTNYSQYMHKFRSTCSEAISSCFYNNEEFPCCDEFLPIDTYHGPCFGFNSLVSGKYTSREDLPFKITRDSNFGYGNLSIELYHDGFIVYGLSQDSVPTKESSSEFVLLDSRTSSGIVAKTAYKAFLSVKETFTDEAARLMKIANRGCRFYDENNLQHAKLYSTSACVNECLVEAQREICNCTYHILPHNDQVKDCDFEGLLCTIDNKKVKEKTTSCSCTSSCSDVEVVNIGFTKTPIHSSQFRNDKSQVRIDFIVYPPTLRYSRSVVKTPLTMLVSVGGSVGLFVGASLLTVVEIIYYFFVRPLGDKYIKHERNKEIKKSEIDNNLDSFYYKYDTLYEFVN